MLVYLSRLGSDWKEKQELRHGLFVQWWLEIVDFKSFTRNLRSLLQNLRWCLHDLFISLNRCIIAGSFLVFWASKCFLILIHSRSLRTFDNGLRNLHWSLSFLLSLNVWAHRQDICVSSSKILVYQVKVIDDVGFHCSNLIRWRRCNLITCRTHWRCSWWYLSILLIIALPYLLLYLIQLILHLSSSRVGHSLPYPAYEHGYDYDQNWSSNLHIKFNLIQ